jgi:hypothetical protein
MNWAGFDFERAPSGLWVPVVEAAAPRPASAEWSSLDGFLRFQWAFTLRNERAQVLDPLRGFGETLDEIAALPEVVR